jgi:hypothetical protein
MRFLWVSVKIAHCKTTNRGAKYFEKTNGEEKGLLIP